VPRETQLNPDATQSQSLSSARKNSPGTIARKMSQLLNEDKLTHPWLVQKRELNKQAWFKPKKWKP